MIEKIIAAPWAFALLLCAVTLLQIGCWVRIKHDNKLSKRRHEERRNLPRLLPDNRWDINKRKQRA